tara:strand:+ start:1015 stop:1245 length:231 start_codon:yes stop_codon:yes gene_type:complete
MAKKKKKTVSAADYVDIQNDYWYRVWQGEFSAKVVPLGLFACKHFNLQNPEIMGMKSTYDSATAFMDRYVYGLKRG